MKKLFRNLLFTALAAVTFVACEDVPEPYDRPGTGTNVPGTSTEIEGAVGIGTLESPFNAIAALNYGNKLASSEESADYMYIKGKVVSIKEEFSTQYGNGTFYISEDGTTANQFYAYRVLYLGNKKFASGDTQIQVGDSVIICGKITNYNGTIETAQNSGFLYSLNGVTKGGEPTPATPAAEPQGDGTLASPYNVSAALSYIKSLAKDVESENDIYIKGKISQIKEEFGTQYGNGTFYISDDGNKSNEFYVFRTLYLGNKKFASGNTQIQVGDSVIICGKVVNYKGNTPETVANKSYLYKLNGVTSSGGGSTPTPAAEPKGTGTLADPFNVQAALNYTKALAADTETETEVYIKAKVSTIKNNYVADNYGNATFYVSDDGTANNEFYCYRTLYLGNEKYTKGLKLKVGDEVVICGKVVNYKGNTPETVANKSYLYSLNGSTEVTEEGGDDPVPGGEPVVTGNVAKAVSGTTLTLTCTEATESGNTISVDFGAQGWTNAQEVTELTLTDGTKITFAKGGGSNAPKFYDATKGVRLYAKNVMAIEGTKPIAKVVIECDNYNGACVGNELLYGTVDGNTLTIINEHTGASGGTQFRPKTMTITYAQ